MQMTVIIDKTEQEVPGSLSQMLMTYEEIAYRLQEYFMCIIKEESLRYECYYTHQTLILWQNLCFC